MEPSAVPICEATIANSKVQKLLSGLAVLVNPCALSLLARFQVLCCRPCVLSSGSSVEVTQKPLYDRPDKRKTRRRMARQCGGASCSVVSIKTMYLKYTQTLLHTDTFTHRLLYTQTLLHTDAVTHKRFYTQTLLHAQMSSYAWEPASRPYRLQHDNTFSSNFYYQHVLLCLGTRFET